jgi:hypothetical protein
MGGHLRQKVCLGWFLLPLRQWIEALQSWLLGLGLWSVLIFTMILIVVTFLPAALPAGCGLIAEVLGYLSPKIGRHFRERFPRKPPGEAIV